MDTSGASHRGDQLLSEALLQHQPHVASTFQHLGNVSRWSECTGRLKRSLRKKFQSVSEGVARAGGSAPLNQIYTELYITEGGTYHVNQEHEVRQMDAVTRNQTSPETTIRSEDLFKASPDIDRPIRSLLTKGTAGIGKTLLTQKLTLDWAEDKAHQNLQLVCPFTFRELNLLSEKKLSLVELVHLFFPETEELSSLEGVQVLFILDGLDECRLPLDFNRRFLTAATESTSVDVLLTNLIRGKLLPSAHVWITTRPAAANQIPPDCVDRVTEVRGFTDLQKEKYFRKRFRDEEQTAIISHIRSSRSLYIMCHIPIFCWIIATVLQDMLKSRETEELPNTLTEMYIHFLVVQVKVKKLKYHGGAGTDSVWDPESRRMMESLGKLAFEHLQRGNLIFYESDLTECGIDITAAAIYSGVFTMIFREERGLYQDKVFCFIHLSLQEFLAALHVHLTFVNSGVNLLDSQQTVATNKLTMILRYLLYQETFYQRAINEAVKSPCGHLDLFLRFLLGLSLQTNQRLLSGLLPKTRSSSWTHQDTAELIKKSINENVSPERTINLFHCLSEVKETSLVEEVQQQLRSGRLSTDQLSPIQWSTLAFILLSSEEHLEVFDLQKYSASEEVLERLLPVVLASKEVLLGDCQLSERSGSLLASVLSSPSSRLTQLDLSHNKIKDSGLELLSEGLKNPHCHLETLRLRDCELSKRSGSLLASVLSSPSSRLVKLDLSDNKLKDPGVELLCEGLKSPHCHLETLSLSGCMIAHRGCATLASALRSNPSHLRELDLSFNHIRGPGLDLLSAGLEKPDWRLETLWVDRSGPQRLASGPERHQLQSNQQKKDELYPLNSNPVGLCLIINNKNFQDGSTRRGTDRDAQSLGEVFRMLGFRVLMCEDQTMEQMRRGLRSFSSLSDHTQVQGLKEFSRGRFTELQEAPQHGDAFFCCILSHGLKGVILGVDRKALSVKEITAAFMSTHQLTGRPKVFLIQACQGGREQQGVMVPDMEADLEEDGHQASIPEEADVLVAMATVEDCVSLRHRVNGSWFIQTLCEELRIGSQREEDFVSILTRVNNEVSKKEGYRTVGARKQMPEFRSTLRKRLVL